MLSAFHSLALAHTDLHQRGGGGNETGDEDEDEEGDKEENEKVTELLIALLAFSDLPCSAKNYTLNDNVYIGNKGGKRGCGGLNVMALKEGGCGETGSTYFRARVTYFNPYDKTVDVTFETKTKSSTRFDKETMVEMYNVKENVA